MSKPDPILIQCIQDLSHPTIPVEPDLPARFSTLISRKLPRPARAVLFDIYGTLFTSASGDIGSVDHKTAALATAMECAGIDPPSGPGSADIIRRFLAEVEADHDRKRRNGVSSPEIEIREIWQRATKLFATPAAATRFSLCYEMESNPVWPMPGARATLSEIGARLPMGVVSNAQFYTPLLFPALLGATLAECGFDPGLIALSYEMGFAKPNPELFTRPLAELAGQGIESADVVYIGNDMLNDVTTASIAGCMTILFAGDQRSLRLRSGHQAVESVMPDSVVRTLSDAGTLILGPKEK